MRVEEFDCVLIKTVALSQPDRRWTAVDGELMVRVLDTIARQPHDAADKRYQGMLKFSAQIA